MHKYNTKLLVGLILSITPTLGWCNDQIFKCKEPDGTMVYQPKACGSNTQALSAWTQSNKATQQQSAEIKETLTLQQASNGYYFVDGEINGSPQSFLVDTGATTVSIPSAAAASAGIECNKQTISDTANGLTHTCSTIISEVKFGQFIVKDVLGTIVPNLRQPLLGMNILKEFLISQDKNGMHLTPQ